MEAIHRQQLQSVGIPARSLIPFGTRCHVQERTWNTNSRGGGTWSSRVTSGRIVAPSVHVSRGYVILVLDDEGQERLFVSTSVRTAGQDESPGIELEVQSLVVPHVSPNPPRRLRQKTTVPSPVCAAEGSDESVAPLQDAALRLRDAHGESSGTVDGLLRSSEGFGLAHGHGSASAADPSCIRSELHRLDRVYSQTSLRMMSATLARAEHHTDQCRANARGRLSVQQSEQLAQCMLDATVADRFQAGALIMSTFQAGTASRAVDRQAQGPGAWTKTLGAYVHGGVMGVTSEAKLRPKLVQLCNKLAWQHACRYPSPEWSALRISCDNAVVEHVDSHNCPSSRTFVVPLSVFEGGRVVVNGVPQDFGSPPCACISPRIPHGVEDAAGTRLVLIAYTPRNGERMSMQDKLFLHSLGFPLPISMTFPNHPGNGHSPPLLEKLSANVAAAGTRLVLIAYTPRNGERMSMQDKLFLHSLGFPLPISMTFPNHPSNGHSPPLLEKLSANVAGGVQVDPLIAKERVCSCTPARVLEDNQLCFPLRCHVPLAEVSTLPFNPCVQCFLTCVESPWHYGMEENDTHLQSQLLMHRRLLRELVQQKYPRLQSFGGECECGGGS